jgi:hypothetical protein
MIRSYHEYLNNKLHTRKTYALVLSVVFCGCASDVNWSDPENKISTSEDPSVYTVESSIAAGTSYGTRIINWDSHAHDAYTLEEAVSDFGNIRYGWQEEKLFNSSGTCRIKLLKNLLSADCGVVSKIAVVPGSEYELQFDVKFHSAFDWSRGGKVGFGFSIGDSFSGCNPAWSGDGGTFRVIWSKDNSGDVHFQPYVYYKDQPDSCGNKFGKKYPATGSLVRGHWYTVKLYVKSNTGAQTNGRIKLTIDDTTVLNQSIRWTTNDNKRLINSIYLSTFRGGSEPNWQSNTDGYIYFDNLSWSKLAD